MVGLALYQAWRARNLSTEFAESKHIASALLISFVVSILGVPVFLLVQEQPDVETFTLSFLVTAISTNILCFMFIPKIVYHMKPKTHTNPLASTNATVNASLDSDSRSTVGGGEMILTTKSRQQLAYENKSLKQDLALATEKNAQLLKRLQELASDENNEKEVTTDVSKPNGTKISDERDHSDVNSELSEARKEISLKSHGSA
jgi:hypothetical protein